MKVSPEDKEQFKAVSKVGDPTKIKQNKAKTIEFVAENVEMLLFNFLQELIFVNDADLLLFSIPAYTFRLHSARISRWNIWNMLN